MTGPPGEMPFLDHLEELRQRILRSLGAVVVGFAVGLWLVQQFQLVSLLKRPIAPYLLGGKLVVTSPTEPVMIVFKLGFLVGLVLASPVILWQVWAFLAPALYEREKKAVVPSLFVGLGLFLTGSILAYIYVVPQALRVLFSFQSEAIAPFITYDNYFAFVLQVCLALGVSFELPLVLVILSWLGVIGPADLHRFRRYAIVLSFIAGAVLSPGADVLSMIMMTVPLLLLYEVGVAGAALVHRRRKTAAAAGVMLLALLGIPSREAAAQVPTRKPQALQDSLRRAAAARGQQTRHGDSSAENVGLDLGEGDAQPVRDVLIGHLLVMIQHQRNALMIGQALERLLHPLLRAESQRRIAAARAPYVVHVVPLLVESPDYRSRVHRVLVVDSPEEAQVERVRARSGISEKEVRAIMATQSSREKRRAAADDVIDNSGTLDALQKQVRALHAGYLERARHLRR